VRELDCTNDLEALEAAQKFLDGHDLELWSRERHIASIPSAGSASTKGMPRSSG
jgi:hypothetical protein